MKRTAPRQFRHVHAIHKAMSDGTTRRYYYHRISKTRLPGDYGSPEFVAAYEEAVNGRRRSTATRIQSVYFVKAETMGLVKIGVTQIPAVRMRAMQTNSPDRLSLIGTLEDRTGALERDLHARFAKHRSHGEWFRHEGELAAFIGEHFGPGS
jgi:hypothetical protein